MNQKTTAAPPIISVERVSKKFQNTYLFKNISFKINAGETVGLLGPNGAGKTTLLNILLGLIRPDTGTIRLFSLPLEQNLQYIRKRINYASAFSQLQGYATVYENLKTFAGLYQVKNSRRKIDRLLKTFRLSDPEIKARKVFKLSSGENTKLNLCKALLNDPEILLLDEPTAGLDSSAKRELLTLIKKIKRERPVAIIYATNVVTEVMQICARSLVLKNGKIRSVKTMRLTP